MQHRTALVAAVLCGLAAVALVGADVVWSLEARLDTQAGNEWETVAAQPGEGLYREGPFRETGCAGPDLRLVVTNDKPFADTVEIRITYFDANAKRTQTVYEDTWRLDRFEERIHTFTIPDSAFEPVNETDDRDFIAGTNVDVRVGDLWLGTCVEREASQ